MGAVTIRDVRKNYGSLEVLHGVSIDIADGEFVILVGPSGCGKSTLLRMIAGLEDITDGEIEIAGTVVNDLAPKDRDIAMVFQSYALYPTMTVRENMAFGMESRGIPRAQQEEAIKRVSTLLQIEPLMHRKPGQLSGGQRQRVAMGRALVRDPLLFLFDEPLSNLDAELRVQMRVELAGLYNRLGTTMIYVTHDQTEAMTMATRIAVLNKGNLEQVGTPFELYNNPRNLFVASFIGSPKMNLIKGKASGQGIDLAGVGMLTARLNTQGDVTVGIRPEHLTIDAPGDIAVEGIITLVEYLGSELFVYVALPNGQTLMAQAPGNARHQRGDKVTLGFRAADAHFFNAEGLRIEASA